MDIKSHIISKEELESYKKVKDLGELGSIGISLLEDLDSFANNIKPWDSRERELLYSRTWDFITFARAKIKNQDSFFSAAFDTIRSDNFAYRIDPKYISKIITKIFQLYQQHGEAEIGANFLYDAVNMHPAIQKVSEKLFKDGHYSQAVFEAFKQIELLVKGKSDRYELYGTTLMQTVFSVKAPVLKFRDKDEQEGFMYLFSGSMRGIKDKGSHNVIEENDLHIALEYLMFASLLARKIDEAKNK